MAKRTIDIDWDTDGFSAVELCLPDSVQVPEGIEEENIADWLSDTYGFCVNSFTFTEK